MLKVLFLARMPSGTAPHRCVFNLRAARSIQAFADVTALHLGLFRPGRSLKETETYAGIRVVRLAIPGAPYGLGRRWTACAKIVNTLLQERIVSSLCSRTVRDSDLIHSVGQPVLGSLIARRFGKKHVAQFIGSDVQRHVHLLRLWSRWVKWEEHVSCVVCNSTELGRFARANLPHVPPVEVVYRGVDLAAFSPTVCEKGPLVNQSGVRFLYLGGLPGGGSFASELNKKGGVTLLRAWRAAEEDIPSGGATLLFAGPRANRGFAKRFRNTLRRPESLILASTYEPSAVAGILRSADAVLVPSPMEGLPNVAVEAQACGVPVIGSRVGGLPEVVSNGETGILIPPDDVKAWSEVIVGCAVNPGGIHSFRAAARGRSERLFDAGQWPKRMWEIYKALSPQV